MQKDKPDENEIETQGTQDAQEAVASEEANMKVEQPEEEQEEVDPIEAARQEVAEAKDKYLRLYSEFENFRRRTAKEKIDLIQSANKNLMTELVPVMDDFERAIQSMDDKTDAKTAKEGVDLIYNKFRKTLETKGLKKMEIEKGDEFNDDYHEAITQIPAEEKLAGKIVDVIENGYFLNEKVVRFAKVVTGAKS